MPWINMKASPAKLSLVMPVRNGQHRIATRVTRALDILEELTSGLCELVVVDDGSIDQTVEMLDELREFYPQIRIVRHSRPRGMESAGQSGLEKATGDLVLIQESEGELRLEDMRELVRMADDPSIIAARAESSAVSATSPLVRRLRAWAGNADKHLDVPQTHAPAVQLIRRPALNQIAMQSGSGYRLQASSMQWDRDR
jgi:glycosyltransferase involved in cell wall biosynthesis